MPLPSESELDEFRNVLAAAKAEYAGDYVQAKMVWHMIHDPVAHVAGLRALIYCLLLELDTCKRDSSEVMEILIEGSAIQETRK